MPANNYTSASVMVARKEPWRRLEVQKRMREFQALTGIPAKSQILSIVIGSKDKTSELNRELLASGFYMVTVGPPVVPPNTWRYFIISSPSPNNLELYYLVFLPNH